MTTTTRRRTAPGARPAVGAVAAGRRARGRRRALAIAALVVAVLAVAFLALCLGERATPPGEVVRVLAGERVPGATFTVMTLRLPRVLTAVLVGLAFGAAGATFQTMLRNPLASPDVIGISAGASAVAVVALVFAGLSGTALSLVAVLGGTAVAAVVYVLSWHRGVPAARFVLVGIAAGAMLSSVTLYTMTRVGVYQAAEALRWVTGSLNGATWQELRPLAVAVALLLPALLLIARRLPALQLGDEACAGLGVHPSHTRFELVVLAVALTSVATAVAGPVAFVALLSGPVASALLRRSGSAVLPAALVGALLVVTADLLGQHLLPGRVPVGAVTGGLGAPYLLWQLARTNRKGAGL